MIEKKKLLALLFIVYFYVREKEGKVENRTKNICSLHTIYCVSFICFLWGKKCFEITQTYEKK